MYSGSRRTQSNIYTAEQVKRVLSGAGIDIVNEVDSDYIIYCPYHNNNRTPAGEVSKTDGTFFCFSCQTTTNLVEFVMHVSGRSFFESTRYIKGKEQNIDIEKQINKTLYQKPDYTEYDINIINRLNEQALKSSRAAEYYLSRSITKESVEKFLLGYSEKQDMITIPIHSPDGMPLGFVARTVEGKEFKNTTGLPKSKVLFNLHKVKSASTLYVVESSLDAIRLDQVGFSAVATLGANISKTQTDLLQKYFNDIIVITDNDDAGNSMFNKIAERLGSRVSRIKLDSNYKDVGDMTNDELKSLAYSFDKDINQMIGI
jgi:DNA primase